MIARDWINMSSLESIKKQIKRVLHGRRKSPCSPSSVPNHLTRHHRSVDPAGLEQIRKSLETNYHVGWRSREHYSIAGYERDVRTHLHERLQHDRNVVVPWLDSMRGLSGSQVLEIGCGTGSSTIALAEQGATVIGIDVDEGALLVARDRCEAYGVTAELLFLNATDIKQKFSPCPFDYIIFFACLEHMTIDERLASLSQAWSLLRQEGLLVIVETPNRLWYKDDHTSLLPFFHWLPNDLAFKYSRFSPRENFHEVYREYTIDAEMHFLRRGRGFSFHEVDLAIAPVSCLNMSYSLSEYCQTNAGLKRRTLQKRYLEFLKEICPGVPPAFFEPQLDLSIVRKD